MRWRKVAAARPRNLKLAFMLGVAPASDPRPAIDRHKAADT